MLVATGHTLTTYIYSTCIRLKPLHIKSQQIIACHERCIQQTGQPKSYALFCQPCLPQQHSDIPLSGTSKMVRLVREGKATELLRDSGKLPMTFRDCSSKVSSTGKAPLLPHVPGRGPAAAHATFGIQTTDARSCTAECLANCLLQRVIMPNNTPECSES